LAHIGLVEDDPGGRRVTTAVLGRAGFEVTAFPSAEAYTAVAPDVDVLLTDLMLPGMDGLDLLDEVLARAGAPEVVLITAYGTADVAAKAMTQGAFHFLTKPLDPDLLVVTVRRAVERRSMRSEVAHLRDRLAAYEGHQMLGASAAMDVLRDQLSRLASAGIPVMVQGQSGAGKELAARALHRAGDRANGPFVAINCAAIPENLLESELFGHLRGAFTGADHRRKGCFVEADRGTLFLDEVSELPEPMQAKLLRALETGEIRPLGSDKPLQVDVRVVSASNRERVQEHLREDLYYRLAGVTVRVPGLAHRRDDIPLLIARFLTEFGGDSAPKLGPAALDELIAREWPGNVRELRNMAARLCALHPGENLQQLPAEPTTSPTTPPGEGLAVDPTWTLTEVEEAVIAWTLKRFDGNREQAAKHLQVSARTLYRRLAANRGSGH
jgi:DNA-binding NtrC family response regulator